MILQETYKLENGTKIPKLGLGTWCIDNDKAAQTVRTAVTLGYRLIDTAQAYENEQGVGEGIRSCSVSREELFVASKVAAELKTYEAAAASIEETLEKMGLDYLDLYLIHQPYGDVYGSWRAMEELYEQGVIRAIGTANFYPDHLANLISFNRIAPVVNQVECNVFFQQREAQEYMAGKEVAMEGWAPFAEGRNDLFRNEVLARIGEAHGKTVAQVVLRWLLQRGVVCIPKSTHRDRMEQNFDVFDFALGDDEMVAIAALDTGRSAFFDHHDPATIEWMSGLVRNV